jgi:hypothetical protein
MCYDAYSRRVGDSEMTALQRKFLREFLEAAPNPRDDVPFTMQRCIKAGWIARAPDQHERYLSWKTTEAGRQELEKQERAAKNTG